MPSSSKSQFREGTLALSALTALFVALFIVAPLSSCTRGAKSDAKTDINTLFVALGSSPNTLDPRFATDAAGQRLTGLLFSSLVKAGPDLRMKGEASSHWEYKDKVYTFHLVPNLTFADGTPVRAEDIEFSFQQFMSPRSPFNSAFRGIKKVEVRYDSDQRWVKLHLEEFSATLLSSLSPVKILPKARVLAAGDDFAQEPVGSGPFRLLSRTNNEIRLAARTDHPYAAPKTKFVAFKIIRDDNTRFLKMYKGKLDIAQSELPPQKIATLEKKGDFQIFKYPGLSMTYILLNMRDPILKNPTVRRALSQSIHREEIIAYKLEGLARPATSVLSPANPFFNAKLKPPTFDFEAAKAALQEAAVSGHPLVLKTANSEAAIENGKVLVHQLHRAGLNVRQQSFEWGTFYGDIQKGNFQLATMKWVGSIDPDIYRMALHSREIPENAGRNRGHYSNPRLDKLLEDGLRISDETRRIRHYQEVQRIVYEDLPYIPLWYDTEVAVVHKRVKGYEPPRNGDYSALLKAYKQVP